jgi:zinc transport system permease protein
MFEPWFMRLALVASIATATSLGIIGVYLMVRRVVFFGLVLANAASVGAAIAQAIGWAPEGPSLAAAIGTAILLGGVNGSSLVSAEAFMGWAYAAALAATVLLLASSPGGSTETFHLLFGSVLTVDAFHALVLTLVAVATVTCQVLFGRRFLLVTFDVEAASVAGVNTRAWTLALHLMAGVVVATAVDHIGVLSTFALLTLPSMAALLQSGSIRTTFVIATLLGMVVSAAALALSFALDLPAGPTTVALLALAVPLAATRRWFPPAVGRTRWPDLLRRRPVVDPGKRHVSSVSAGRRRA